MRKRLAEELGVDPSPDLRGVYATLLERADEHANLDEQRVPAVVPHQLPARIRGFVGRDDQLSDMDRVLTRSSGQPDGAVLALHGPAGAGKTTLAVHWAHHVRDEFPDGELFLDLRGYGPGDPMSTEQSLAALLRGLGVPGERIADDVDDRRAMLRSETHGRRMLVVLDNARDAEQVRPLLPGADAFVLVTSRTQLRGLAVREAADRVRVDPMSPAESIALLQRRTGGDVGEAALRELAELCGHLPVALAVAAERIGRVDHDPHPVEAFIAELGDHRSRLGALDSGDDDPLTNVRAVLDWSYRSLDDDSARTFRLLGLYSAPLISTGAVAALIGVEPARTNRPIDRLTDRHLLTPIRDGHYVMHDLVRAFAAQVADEEPEPDRVAATRRLRNWFAHSTARARLAWAPRIAGVHLPDLEPGVAPENFDSPKAGFAWLETNAAYVLRLVAACIEDEDATGHQLAPLLFSYLQSSGMATDSLELFRRAEESARRLGDAVGQAACANSVAGCHFERNEMDEAIGAVERARDLYAAAGDVDGGLRAQSNLAVALYTLDRVDEAIAAFERAIDDARELGARGRLGWNLFNASDVYLSAGRVDDAIHAAEESVDVLGEADSDARALAVDNLGDVQAATGRLADAVETMRTAIEAYRALYMRKDEASALRKLGIFHRDLGERDAARDCWSEALQVLSTIGVAETREVGREELTLLIESLDVPVSDA
ncbi:tetratricopeptide repeat protein [Solicola gregarius]|uniref:Tetratricopeptide repeat protein n=1 Tax=Solicola gregarius TaxID=2908642 RepID=A0AA46YMN8_9ACTN|nr:tetratricopeptide repeat protein [Solicola gregarius]UYM06809.1 tetratricopeptide repeat protein [Solicola gregarius]